MCRPGSGFREFLQETGKTAPLAWGCTQLLAPLRTGHAVGSVGSGKSMGTSVPGRRKSARKSPPNPASDVLTLVQKRQARVCEPQEEGPLPTHTSCCLPSTPMSQGWLFPAAFPRQPLSRECGSMGEGVPHILQSRAECPMAPPSILVCAPVPTVANSQHLPRLVYTQRYLSQHSFVQAMPLSGILLSLPCPTSDHSSKVL